MIIAAVYVVVLDKNILARVDINAITVKATPRDLNFNVVDVDVSAVYFQSSTHPTKKKERKKGETEKEKKQKGMSCQQRAWL